MLFQSFVLLGFAASTMADGFCVAFGPEAPPISLWKWVPEPVAAATATATTDGSVQPITTATVQPATTATLGTTSDAWAGWDEVSTTASQSPLVSSTSSAVSDVKPVLTSSTSGASAVSPEQTTTSVKHFVPSAAPTTLVSKFVPTTSSSAAASSASTTSGSKPSNSVDATSTGVEPTSAAPSEVFFGLGTRYGGDCKEEDCWQKGACSFVDYDLPSAVDGSTCVSEDIWNNGANCGGCISVSYKGKTITVMVTNLTGGNATHLDMTPNTWAKLTNGYTGGGVDGIEWEWVTCPIPETEPLWIRMHGGASKWWFSATVENARERTAKLEVSSDGGKTWQGTTFNNYNMFVLDGTLPGDTATVRVTSVTGSQVIVDNVVLKSEAITKASENY